MFVTEIKLQAKGYRYPVQTWIENGRHFFKFGYNKDLLTEIKTMQGSHYHGYDDVNPQKLWSVPDTRRNRFQLDYLQGKKVYQRYDSELDVTGIPVTRYNLAEGKMKKLFNHQPEMVAQILQRHDCIIAGEMGTAKTLADIIASEIINANYRAKHGQDMDWWYIAPKAPLKAVERQFNIWGAKIRPSRMLTYEGLTKIINNWDQGTKAPFKVTADESSKVKNWTAQRSQALFQLATGQWNDWKQDSYMVLMSGSPAPKSPVDWWSQAEIACPGFLKEGDIHKFKKRLGIIIQKQNLIDGGVYPQLVTWRDDENKCDICGQLVCHEAHSSEADIMGIENAHAFIKSKNEVYGLYKRLKGLVVVYMKKDCLDLPDKNYRIIEVKPTKTILRLASLLTKTSATTIEALTLIRELSDGFQYTKIVEGKEPCARCKSTGAVNEPQEIEGTCETCKNGIPKDIAIENSYGIFLCPSHKPQYQNTEQICPRCNGTKQQDKISRSVKQVACPKDQVVLDLLEEHEDIGRIIFYAGFTGSVERVMNLCFKSGWGVIQLNDSKELVFDEKGQRIDEKDYQSVFQDWKDKYPRVAIVAHPASGGMGLTLTASPTIVYYSNDFNFDNRIQSEDRIHRPGMDLNLGATIIDIVHLPTDLKVINNLKSKKSLQAMTLGEISKILESTESRIEE